MRGLLTLLGVLTIVLGAFLVLQGFNLLPGKSSLNGDHGWAFYGACLALGGSVLMRFARGPDRRRQR